MKPFALSQVRSFVDECCERLIDRDGCYGAYRAGIKKRTDLYATTDVAILRALMGEDLLKLPQGQRDEWIAHINSFASQTYGISDGSYFDTFGHSKLHANGMVISALGVLGGKQPFRVKLYEQFDTPEKIPAFLESIDWAAQWSASHLFWGGMHYYSFSRHCPQGWRDAVFAWLDKNLDPNTGWWRKGVAHTDRHQPLGGSVHIVTMYEHHDRHFPCPQRVIDSVLALQLENGGWLKAHEFWLSYLELDALYAYRIMGKWAPDHRRAEIAHSVERFGVAAVEFFSKKRAEMLNWHPHSLLALVGAFGLLQQLAPESFVDDATWTDIFSDRRLYRTLEVEAE